MPPPPFPLMILIRFLDDVLNQQWLIVKEGQQYEGQSVDEAMEVTRLPWNDDLIMWMNTHQKEIEVGDVNTFLEYRRLHCASQLSSDNNNNN